MENKPLPVTFTVEEVATALKLSSKTVYNRVKDGTIPTCSPITREIRISAETLRQILNGELPLNTPKPKVHRRQEVPLDPGLTPQAPSSPKDRVSGVTSMAPGDRQRKNGRTYGRRPNGSMDAF